MAPDPDCPPEHPRPALILLDYDLGEQCGTDFLYWLRTLHRNALPVVLYSGSDGEGPVNDCYANGATHFLKKARSFAGIEAAVRALHVCFRFPAGPVSIPGSPARVEARPTVSQSLWRAEAAL